MLMKNTDLSVKILLQKCFTEIMEKEALAIRRVFSLVDMITNTKFSNCTLVFKIGAVRQQNMQCKHQIRFKAIYH